MLQFYYMKVNLTPPDEVLDILKKFKKAKYEIYIVGGVVRDALLEKPLYDWDFTTNATPEEILKLFPEGFYDNKFGTVGIKNEEGKPYEITTLEPRKITPTTATQTKFPGENIARGPLATRLHY